MDATVKELIRYVARGFYGRPYVLILDAVLVHSVLSEDDLSHLLGIQRKELRSLCNRLIDDRLLTVHVQREEGINGMRPTTKTYYFIHFTEAIDGVKWKVHQVVQGIQKDLKADSSPQGYICPVCKTKYSQLDAMALLNFEKNEFMCSLCNEPLIEDDTGKIAKENQVKYSKLMKQLEPLITYLRKIDEHTIPENNFETSLSKMVPAVATTNATYTVSNFRKNTKMFDRNSYLNNTSSMVAGARSQATLHVDISTDGDDLQREKQAIEQDEKRKQNALPSWHEESTIGKSLGRLDGEDAEQNDEDVKMEDATGSIPEESSVVGDSEMKSETSTAGVSTTNTTAAATNDEGGEVDKEAQEALAAYYAQLDQKAKEDADDEDEEEEEDDDDDDEFDEFEDVDVDVEAEATAQESAVVATATTAQENKEVADIVEELEFDSEDE